MTVNSPRACPKAVRTAAPLPRFFPCRKTRINPGCAAASASAISPDPSVEPSSTTRISRSPGSGAARTRRSNSGRNSSSFQTGTIMLIRGCGMTDLTLCLICPHPCVPTFAPNPPARAS